MESAKSWLRSTFLYVRLRSNPGHYKFDQGGRSNDINRSLEEICDKNLNLLDSSGLILNNGSGLRCSELGDAMARYYIKFGTMKTILDLEEKAKVPEVVSKQWLLNENPLLIYFSCWSCLKPKSSRMSGFAEVKRDSTRSLIRS